MEKLQAALEKARKQREEIAATDLGSSPVPGEKQAPTAPPTHHDALWDSLPTFTVNDQQIDRYHLVSGTPTAAATHFDILRTKVLLQMKENNWTRLAITSPMPASGKTTTACNLALGLGRQDNLRTILMDTDLRAPSLSEFFNTTPPHGISDVLTGRVDFGDQAMRLGKNVACCMANKAETDPARILLAEQTSNVLDEIEARYKPDIMIFDLPSMLVSDDTRAFLKNVDCALLVIRSNVTRFSQLDTCEREAAGYTNVMGVVLNGYMSAMPDQQ